MMNSKKITHMDNEKINLKSIFLRTERRILKLSVLKQQTLMLFQQQNIFAGQYPILTVQPLSTKMILLPTIILCLK